MSAGGQTTGSRDIPSVRRVTIHDAAHMPQDYSTTPGGTLFSTTPGGNDVARASVQTSDTVLKKKVENKRVLKRIDETIW